LKRQLRTGRGAVGAVVLAALVAAALPGCGDSEGSSGPTANLQVTRDFGRETIMSEEASEIPSRPTVVRALREHTEVRTEFEGLSIRSIGELSRTDKADGNETTWALLVNGIEADVAPVEYKVYPGDVVQLDLRDWYVTLDVRATVGAFPETFSKGAFGRLFPVTVRCEDRSSWACRHVKQLLRQAGVPPDGSGRPKSERPKPPNPRRAQILVGKWSHWRSNGWARRIDEGPRYSGVFARFAPNAGSLRLLDWNGHRVGVEGAGTGLVAAQRPTELDLQWMVTGVDDEGVERAARALGSPDLRNAFAAVVTADGVEKVPLTPPDAGDSP
jgi:hypothetical protein